MKHRPVLIALVALTGIIALVMLPSLGATADTKPPKVGTWKWTSGHFQPPGPPVLNSTYVGPALLNTSTGRCYVVLGQVFPPDATPTFVLVPEPSDAAPGTIGTYEQGGSFVVDLGAGLQGSTRYQYYGVLVNNATAQTWYYKLGQWVAVTGGP